MGALLPNQIWWTAAEIAAAKLPYMPTAMSGVDARARRLNWRAQPNFARRRTGRGGGWEYRWELFSIEACKKLLREATPMVPKIDDPDIDSLEYHQYFDDLPERVKAKARQRLHVIQQVEAMVRTGVSKFLSVEFVAQDEGISGRTIWNWFTMIDFLPEQDWLPALAPRHRAAIRNIKKAECSPEFMEHLKSDYLRLERPSFNSCYRRCDKIAKAKAWVTLPSRTARRRLNELVPRVTQVFAREGAIGLARCFPPQTRDRTSMVAMEGVNADCHKFDVFVIWPGEDKPSRAQIICFQDIYSGKILSWRVDHNPNKVAVMAAFGDMIEDYGIPQHCLFDNGTEFTNKWLTGGAKSRFRGKIIDDDPLGILTLLGIKIHWALPAHGQAKPIERAFRDFADDIAKDPRFAGAYVGHKPDAKPENYGDRAIPIEDFIAVVGEGIKDHNARLGRRSETVLGGSFDEAFAASYATTPIRKASVEQRRLWLMGQEVLTLHKGHGRLTMHQNKYFSDWMNEFAGTKIVARFDPEDLHAGVHIYELDGSFMGFAACEEKVGFFNLTGAKDLARKTSAIKRTERKLLAQHRSLKPKDIAAALDAIPSADPVTPEAKVVQAEFGKKSGNAPLVQRPEYEDNTSAEETARHEVLVANFNKEKEQRDAAQQGFQVPDDARERYLQAVELEDRAQAGERVGKDEMNWLNGYQQSSEYRAEKSVLDLFRNNS